MDLLATDMPKREFDAPLIATESPAQLRTRAARMRSHALFFANDDTGQRLRGLADELDARVTALEKNND
jgi:hypothetical protein